MSRVDSFISLHEKYNRHADVVSTIRKYKFGISLMVGVEGIDPGTESLFPLAGPWYILEAAGRNFLRKNNIKSLFVFGFGMIGCTCA